MLDRITDPLQRAAAGDFASRDARRPAREFHLRIDTVDLWRQFKAQPTDVLRNELIERRLHLVRYHAERIHVKLPAEVELDDLISAGIFGLIDAINAFDLDRGVKFETYAAPRIRGAIIDELRAMDFVPRLTRSRAHKLDRATRQLELELNREPTKDELAGYLKVSLDELERMTKDANPKLLLDLEHKVMSNRLKDVRLGDVLEDSFTRDPAETVANRDERDNALRGLSRKQRLVFRLYHEVGMTMKEIGGVMKVSESRISQSVTQIMGLLRDRFGEQIVPKGTYRRLKHTAPAAAAAA